MVLGNITRSLPWYFYSCYALIAILSNKLVIYPGITLNECNIIL